MSYAQSLSIIPSENGIAQYIRKVRNIPSLEHEEEISLARRMIDYKDIQAAQKLVSSHLKLVVKTALGFRKYGLPISDLISEGNLGLMQAVRKFNPDLGNRLSTYALWWIKASIQEYILKTWSLVKIGTTAVQKSLFFNLHKLKSEILRNDDSRELRLEEYRSIANKLGFLPNQVEEMDRRLFKSDVSLNISAKGDYENELINNIPESRPNQEQILISIEKRQQRKSSLAQALNKLNERERRIFTARRLEQDPPTLETLGAELGLSAERVRQLEVRSYQIVKSEMLSLNT